MSALKLADDPIEASVAIVGAGAAGMTSALVLERLGLRPLLLEKSVDRPCNTELGGGLIQAAGTAAQRAAGISDTPAAMKADIMTKNHGCADAGVVEAVCNRSADVIEFLTTVVGLELHLDTNVRFPGHSEYRMHASPKESGAEIAAALRECVKRELGERFFMRAPVRHLLKRDGAVIGVEIERETGLQRAYTDEVVLACNGFAANQDLLSRHIPEMAGSVYIGSPNSTGEAAIWGQELGAALDHMTAYQAHAHVNVNGTRLGGGLPSLGCILVNASGQRFSREDQGYSEYAIDVLAQPGGTAVEIFDQSAYNAAVAAGSFRAAEKAGEVVRFDSIEELADYFELPTETLVRELKEYNAGAAMGKDRLGRVQWLRPLEPPLYGSRVTGALVHTQGGLRIDSQARVLRSDGTPVPGLSATGGAAAGMSGDGVDGYLSGNGLIHALATGLIAGERLAGRSVRNASPPIATGGSRE